MPRATWLADVLRGAGLHVIEMSGWKTRETRAGFDPRGIVCHHTATPKSMSDLRVRNLLRDGRADLRGPLCQLGLERDGTFVVIAAGRCNHNGFGMWGNDSIGIEAYNDGVGEPWPKPQMDAYVEGVAAICRRKGWKPLQVQGHKETDPGRKIDPTFDMAKFRGRVSVELKTPVPTPPVTAEESEVAAYALWKNTLTNQVFAVAADRQSKILVSGAVQAIDEFFLAQPDPFLANTNDLRAWLNSVPTA